MNSYEKGNLSEAVIAARLLESGYIVCVPIGGGHRYDMVIDTGDGFKKIQVKTARLYNGNIMFNTCSNNKGRGRKSYHGDIDMFGVYCPELAECYLVPVELTGRSLMSLRINPPKNNQTKGVNFKDKFRISKTHNLLNPESEDNG